MYDPEYWKLIFGGFPEGPITTEKDLRNFPYLFLEFGTGNHWCVVPPGVPNPQSIAEFYIFSMLWAMNSN